MENLKLWTSYVEKDLFRKYVDLEILPIFISRNLLGNQLVAGWNNTSVHFPELSPTPELFKAWKYGSLSEEKFKELFRRELKETDIRGILEKISVMCSICNATGAILLGYGEDITKDYRRIVSEYIDSTGILQETIEEWNNLSK